jgi:hypothetical protein
VPYLTNNPKPKKSDWKIKPRFLWSLQQSKMTVASKNRNVSLWSVRKNLYTKPFSNTIVKLYYDKIFFDITVPFYSSTS